MREDLLEARRDEGRRRVRQQGTPPRSRPQLVEVVPDVPLGHDHTPTRVSCEVCQLREDRETRSRRSAPVNVLLGIAADITRVSVVPGFRTAKMPLMTGFPATR